MEEGEDGWMVLNWYRLVLLLLPYSYLVLLSYGLVFVSLFDATDGVLQGIGYGLRRRLLKRNGYAMRHDVE